jgi:hypothetical protein
MRCLFFALALVQNEVFNPFVETTVSLNEIFTTGGLFFAFLHQIQTKTTFNINTKSGFL